MTCSPQDLVSWMDHLTRLGSCNSLCVHKSQKVFTRWKTLPDTGVLENRDIKLNKLLRWWFVLSWRSLSSQTMFNRWKPSAETLTGIGSWRCIEDSARAASVFGEVLFSVADRRWIKRWINDLLAAAVMLVRWITTSHLWPHLQACISAQSQCVLVFVGSGADQL